MRINVAKIVPPVSLVFGSVAILVAFLESSSVLALAGIGLVFWGFLFLYVRTEEYVKKNSVNNLVDYQLDFLLRIIRYFQCKGTPVFLSPKYLSNPETSKVYIPIKKTGETVFASDFDELEESPFEVTDSGILLTPPGSSIVNDFERSLGVSFTSVDLQFLQFNLPKTIINDLELAQDFEMGIEKRSVTVGIRGCIFRQRSVLDDQMSQAFAHTFSPLISAIACALAKASGSPVMVEEVRISAKNNLQKIQYILMDEGLK